MSHTLSHTNFVTHTHNLSHTILSHTTLSHTTLSDTTLSHTNCQIQLCQTQLCHIQLCHTQLCHTQLGHIQLCHTQLVTHTHNFHVAGIALGDIRRRFTWQAWHLATSTFVLRGRRGTYDTWLDLVTRLVPRDAAPSCVAGMALGGIHRRFTWQAWHLATYTFLSRGRRGTYGTGLALVMRLVPRDAAALLRGRRGTWRNPPGCRFAWQAWHF